MTAPFLWSENVDVAAVPEAAGNVGGLASLWHGRDADVEGALMDAFAQLAVAGEHVWFWRSPGGSTRLGVGATVTVTGDGPVAVRDGRDRIPPGMSHLGGDDRFPVASEAVRTLIGRSRGDGEPIAAGAFAFGPGGPMTGEWKGLSRSHLTIPELLVDRDRPGVVTHTMLVPREAAVSGDGVPVDAGVRRGEALGRVRTALATALVERDTSAIDITDSPSPAAYVGAVDATRTRIRSSALQKLVLARSVNVHADVDFGVSGVLHRLSAGYPSCLVFAVAVPTAWGPTVFVGATPELLLRSDGAHVESLPLAGSMAPGGSAAEDAAAAAALFADPKNREEHALLAAAVERVFRGACTDVTCDATPQRLLLHNVIHLATRVRGRPVESDSFLDLLGTLHPTPAVGAVPVDAVSLIPALEGFERGWYSGPVGWTDGNRGEFGVALRCGLLRGPQATLYAGAGIVRGSDPHDELEETRLKLRPMLDALLRV